MLDGRINEVFDFLAIWHPETEEHQFNITDSPDSLYYILPRVLDQHPMYKDEFLEPQFKPFLFKDLSDAKKALDIVKLYFIENNPGTCYGMCVKNFTSLEYYIVSIKTALVEIPEKIVDINIRYSEKFV